MNDISKIVSAGQAFEEESKSSNPLTDVQIESVFQLESDKAEEAAIFILEESDDAEEHIDFLTGMYENAVNSIGQHSIKLSQGAERVEYSLRETIKEYAVERVYARHLNEMNAEKILLGSEDNALKDVFGCANGLRRAIQPITHDNLPDLIVEHCSEDQIEALMKLDNKINEPQSVFRPPDATA